MEQVEGGELVVNKGSESKPREKSPDGRKNLNAVDGLETAFRLAEVSGATPANQLGVLTVFIHYTGQCSRLGEVGSEEGADNIISDLKSYQKLVDIPPSPAVPCHTPRPG